MYRILVSDKLGQVGLERLEAATDASYDMETGLTPEELIARIPDYDALIVRSGTKVTEPLLAAGTKLKVVGRAGIGIDNIDVRAATARGIIVMNTPQANAIATTEQAMALMLAASRHTVPAHNSLVAGEWKRSHYVGTQLYRKTLGIIGFGRIGRMTATRAQSFGMEVLAFDPYVSEEVALEMGVTLVDLEDLLAQSDFVSLHTAMTPETEKLLNAKAFNQMKDGAVLINAARGKLIDEEALLAALESGKLAMAALDVYAKEPPGLENPLIGHPKVLHTPHLGASTHEAQRDVAIQIVDQVLDALRGDDFRNAINMPYSAGPDFDDTRPFMVLAEKLGVLQANMAPAPIRKVAVAVRGEQVEKLVKPVAAALLKGIMSGVFPDSINYINAPVLAEEHGISISQTTSFKAGLDYTNMVSCHVTWDGGERTVVGVLFGGSEPRIVQVDDYRLEAKPEGIVMMMQNRDVPGVIGQVGTILSAYQVNIGEWRMGRHAPGSDALSFINLDSMPPLQVLDALEKVPAVTSVRLIEL